MKKIFVFLNLILILLVLAPIIYCYIPTESVLSEAKLGIIGGADGPTAVFISTQPSNILLFLYVLIVIITVLVNLFYLIKKRF